MTLAGHPSSTTCPDDLLGPDVWVWVGGIQDAARNGDPERVRELIKENPSVVFAKDDTDKTPLIWAAAENHKGVAELLLANKAALIRRQARNDCAALVS